MLIVVSKEPMRSIKAAFPREGRFGKQSLTGVEEVRSRETMFN